MNHLTLGVAGHIDHGKTALVRALTGMETDRLKEEQERGMSIVLGFAHLETPAGQVDFIDVPGHEKFIHTMISGATGIDAVLLVVSANEIVKPQTVEHVALTELLGVRRGLVAVTKSDLAPDPDERALIADEVGTFLSDTFLRDAPLVFTSSVTGEGLSEIRRCLDGLLAGATAPAEQPYFYLPVDRVFTMTGHGTVVTGTLRRGAIQVGQAVEVAPGGARAQVRGLEVHNKAVPHAAPGGRVAVNLRGLKKDDIERGDALMTPDALRPTRLLDAHLRLLPSASQPLRKGRTVRLYYGTREVSARVHPLDRDEIAPGDTSLVQFRLLEDVVVPVHEPFVIRSVSPVETVGGGTVIDAHPVKHTRRDEATLQHVETLHEGTPAERLRAKLVEAGHSGAELRPLAIDLGLLPAQAERELPSLTVVRCPADLLLDRAAFEDLCARALRVVDAFHAANPTLPGIPREDLRQKLPAGVRPAAFSRVLDELARQGRVEAAEGVVHRAGWSAGDGLTPTEREIARSIEGEFRRAGLRPPNARDVLGTDRRRRNLFQYLIKSGVLVQTEERLTGALVVFHRDALAHAEYLLASHLSGGQGLTVSELNKALDITRKYAIPLLEYMDARGVTRRDGDVRVWGHPPSG